MCLLFSTVGVSPTSACVKWACCADGWTVIINACNFLRIQVGRQQCPHTYYLCTYLIKSLLDSFFVKGETRLNSCFPIDF